MSREREVHKEKDFWGNEKEVIYENGEKVGEFRLEERGGFLGLGAETVKVEYNTDREEVGYTKQENRGGFLGLGAEEVEVRYNTKDEEVGYSRVEERGGFLGLGAHHVRAEYDPEDNELSQTNWEKRGDFLGLGGKQVRVTRFSASQSAQASCAADESASSTGGDYTGGTVPPSSSSSSSGGIVEFFYGLAVAIALTFVTFSDFNNHGVPPSDKSTRKTEVAKKFNYSGTWLASGVWIKITQTASPDVFDVVLQFEDGDVKLIGHLSSNGIQTSGESESRYNFRISSSNNSCITAYLGWKFCKNGRNNG